MPPPTLPSKKTSLPPPPSSQVSVSRVLFGTIPASAGHRIVPFGPGGIGKTTLCCKLPGKTAYVDADESLSVLKTQLKEQGVELPVIVPANDWKSLRACLQSDGWKDINNIVIDSITKVEEWCVAHTIQTVMHPDKNTKVASIEGYGYGKGFQFVFDQFLPLLSDLDRHVRQGRNVVLIAHECISTVPNPGGEDWIRYEPRLQNPSSGKASIRLRIKEWADHVLFLGYDVCVEKDGKAKGSGTKTLHCSELPHCMAKSRTTSGVIDLAEGVDCWSQIIK